MNTNVIRVNFGQNNINAIPTMKPEIVKPEIIIPSGRESTFANIGSNVRSAVTVEQALNMGNLNYKVEKRPIYLSDDTPIPDRYATVRDIDNYVYDIVSDRYTIVQNEDAFGFINYMSEDIQFEKIGETKSGMIYLIASLEPMQILGDTYQPHLCFRNSHNGKFQLSVTICPLRVVCQNQFNVCFKESPNTINIRHSSQANIRLEEASHVLKGTADYMKELNKQAEKWATQKVSNAQIVQILDELFPMDKEMKDYQLERVEEQKILLTKAYQADDNANFRNTMWGMINAYSDFITHKPQYRTTDTAAENNFVAVTFDPKAMMNFINLLSRVAA
jgi:phage/plasmid-like protein (TIGR03299 family)